MVKQIGEEYRPDPESLRRGHETTGINIRGVMWFVVIFVLTAAVIHAVVWIGFRAVVDRDIARAPAVSPLAAPTPPTGPALQPTIVHNRLPWEDVTRMRQEANRELSSYGWVDRQAGIARIPIERAMELVLARRASGATPSSTSEDNHR